MSTASDAFYGSNGGKSKSLCCKLEKSGQRGRIAACLFRAEKSSKRAKKYGDSSGYRNIDNELVPYSRNDRQNMERCLEKLCDLLADDNCGMTWGWGRDRSQGEKRHVLYIDLPQGQVRFLLPRRFAGPQYRSTWDGKDGNDDRIIGCCEVVLPDAADQELSSKSPSKGKTQKQERVDRRLAVAVAVEQGLSVKEAATKHGVTPSTAYKACRECGVPFKRVRKKKRTRAKKGDKPTLEARVAKLEAEINGIRGMEKPQQ